MFVIAKIRAAAEESTRGRMLKTGINGEDSKRVTSPLESCYSTDGDSDPQQVINGLSLMFLALCFPVGSAKF